jgi:hypothetical protein
MLSILLSKSIVCKQEGGAATTARPESSESAIGNFAAPLISGMYARPEKQKFGFIYLSTCPDAANHQIYALTKADHEIY